MGEWQAHRPGLPIAIGLFSILIAMLFAVARGGASLLALPLLGLLSAVIWTGLTRIAAQSALLLAPISVVTLLALWMTAASHVPMPEATFEQPASSPTAGAAATDREADIADRDRGITPTEPGGATASPSR
jgi:hypothetical protein